MARNETNIPQRFVLGLTIPCLIWHHPDPYFQQVLSMKKTFSRSFYVFHLPRKWIPMKYWWKYQDTYFVDRDLRFLLSQL